MPSLIGSLYVSLTADFAPFQRNMRSAEGVVQSTAAGMRRNMGLTTRSVQQFQRSTSHGIRPYALIAAARTFNTVEQRANLLRGSLFAVTAAFGGLGAALTTNVVSRYLDTFTGLENQIRVVANGAADLAAQISAVSGVAERSRSSLSAVATLYSRLAKAAPQEGSIALLRRTETINKALQLGGATAQEAASAAIQFSQAIASNRLGGEELRAVLETPLGLELAKGMGVTIGQFRKLSLQGKLTADVLFKSLDKVANEVDTKFAGSISTIEQAFTVADGKITVFAGKLDDTYGITKLLTSGINKFANNLDSLVPALASVALGLGGAFAGRGIGNFTGRRIKVVKDEIAQRKENLRLATEEYAVARRNADTVASQHSKIAAIGPERARDFADPAAVKRYDRELVNLQKEEKKYLDLLGQRRHLQYQLGTVTTQTTVGAVRASENLANEQIKLNALADQSIVLKNNERAAQNALTGAVAKQSQNTAKIQAVADAEKNLAKVQRDRASLSERIAKQEESVTQRQLQVAQLRTEAERRAANQRAQILVRESQIASEIERSAARRRVYTSSLGAAGANIRTSGLRNISGSQLGSTAGLIQAERAANGARVALGNAARAATGFAVAGAVVGRAWSSVLGLFGGPLGAAFTAAIVGLSYLGIRAQATAEQIARARQIISEELGALAESGKDLSPNAQAAIFSDKILTETDRLRDVEKRLQGIQGDFLDTVSQRAIPLFANNEKALFSFSSGLEKLTANLQSGTITFTQFLDQLRALGVNQNVVEGIRKDFSDLIREGDSAALVIQHLRERLDDLENARATVTVTVDVIDPLGIFNPKVRQPLFNGADLKKQYSQYGFGRNAGRDTTRRAELRQQLLDAAGDTGDKALNTPAKIAKREQELLEGGYANTRGEARKLAEEELNLAEKTRLANKEFGAATKEGEKFSNMIKELQQEASGAFLSDLDQKVLDKAKTLKDGSALMKSYIDALNSGDLSKAPTELLQIRDALQQIGAADTWRNIIQQYGTGAQLASMFAEKQGELNMLVSSGRISADQAGQAWADFIGQFKEYKWIDQTADAIGNFVDEAVSDFNNIEDAFKNLLKSLAKIALQEAVINPIKEWFRGLFASASGGGPTGGNSQSLVNGTFGTGGSGIFGIARSLLGSAVQSVGEYTATRVASPSASSAITGPVASAASSIFRSAGTTKGGIPLSQISAQGFFAKVNASYADRFQGLLNDLTKAGYPIKSLGEGGYSYRNVAGSKNLSNHAFGNAIDINPRQNPQAYGATGNFSQYGIDPNALAEKNGLFWGGNWRKPDTMHFQVDKTAKSFEMLSEKTEKVASSLGGFGDKLVQFAQSAAGGGGAGGWFSNLASKFGGSGGAFNFMNSISPLATRSILSGAVGLFHGGGTAGAGGGSRVVNMAAFAGARRLHKGMGVKSNELPAILEKGEEVMRKRTAGRTVAAMRGLTTMAGNGGRPNVDLTVVVQGGSGDDHIRKLASEGARQALSRYDEIQRRGGSASNDQQYSSLRGGRR